MDEKVYLTIIILGMILAGTGNTLGKIFNLGGKWQDNFTVLNQKFNHPFVQTLAMFIAEFLVGIIFFIKEKFSPSLEFKKNHAQALREVLQNNLG